MLKSFSIRTWDESFSQDQQQDAIHHLEQGQVLHLPSLAFDLKPEENRFLSPDYVDPRSKNVSYHPNHHKLCGIQHLTDDEHLQLKAMLQRFSQSAFNLIKQALPHYEKHLIIARTSFRPVEIAGRKTSYRKDDKRLHVDAFPSAPNQGKRILRVFSNINPEQARVWRLGEPFTQVAERFLPGIPKPFIGKAAALRLLQITKSYRTLYDHYMLQMHDRMKADDHYQKSAVQQEIHFAPGSTWIVQTDDVSHAAMRGQYLLEQTFYLPVTAMRDESRSPLRILEGMLGKALV